MITIAKKPGVKNCVRITNKEDIPEFLSGAVRIDGNELVLDCLEGEERAPIGSVIAFEKLENGKMNVWNKANWATTTIEKDGVFYELPKPYKAMEVADELPEDVVEGLGDRLSTLEDGSFQIVTDWGKAACKPGDGYLVIYGKKEDGSLDANFLAKGTPSFEQYYVLDENNKIVESLSDYDARLTKQRQ